MGSNSPNGHLRSFWTGSGRQVVGVISFVITTGIMTESLAEARWRWPWPRPRPTPTPTVKPSPSPSPTIKPSPSPTVIPSPSPTVKPSPSPTVTPTPTPSPTPISGKPINLSGVWVNEGGDKVIQDELRFKDSPSSTYSSVWNGSRISIKGAQNEIVNFNLVLESATAVSSNIQVKFDTLTHTSGAKIQTTATGASQLYNWTARPIELFYLRYLPIKGLSKLSYETYDERHVPTKLRRPWWGLGYGTGGWADRPNHDKRYPDIAVPLELVPNFSIQSGQNQSVWVDLYIPKTAPAGTYTGNVQVYEGSNLSYTIPVQLQVYGFALPDKPTTPTMVYLGDVGDWSKRYLGTNWPASPADETRMIDIRNKHFMVAHRHKISLIDSDPLATGDQPSAEWLPRLNGSLFTSSQGYAGPGVGVANDIYSIGTYGHWSWNSGTEADMWTHTNAWESWFQANAPTTEHFLYLTDEPPTLTQTAQWSQWMRSNPGIGSKLACMVTTPLLKAVAQLPNLNIDTTGFSSGTTSVWNQAVADFLVPPTPIGGTTPYRKLFLYNGQRPYQGSFGTEDEGVSLRELPWAQYKLGISRWFFWQATYYTDFQSGRGANNVFESAHTFGSFTGIDPSLGETGWNYSNGDGLLFYPGTDKVFSQNSYNVDGPIASLRLKFWRRGIQDTDYLALAAKKDPVATQAIVNQMVPKADWEFNADDPKDPTFTRTDIVWSINPDDWEAARQQLATIIMR